VSWNTPTIPALGRWRQENGKFKASLGYIAKPSIKKMNHDITIF
jgi:hypothetical protein